MNKSPSKKARVWVPTLRGAAVEVGVDAGTLSRWARSADFPKEARGPRGWNVKRLVEFKAARQARSLNPVQAAPADPEVQELTTKRMTLHAKLLTLKAACTTGAMMDLETGKDVLARFRADCGFGLLHALQGIGGIAHDRLLLEKMQVVFQEVVAKHFGVIADEH